MSTITALPVATAANTTDVVPADQINNDGSITTRKVTIAQIGAIIGGGGGGGAVTSVVGQTGVVTAAEISTAIAGSGLTVSGGQLTVTGGGGAVTSVVGQTGVVTATEISTAIAGSGLTVSGGQLTVSGGSSGGVPVTTPGTVGSYVLAFASSGSVCYDFHLTESLTLTMTGGTAGYWQELHLVLRQPSIGGVVVTLPSNVRWLGGSAPAIGTSPNQITVISFATSDGGTTYFGGL